MEFEVAKAKLLEKQPTAINIVEAPDDPCPSCGKKSTLFYQLPENPPSANWPKVGLIDLEPNFWLRGGFFCGTCGWGAGGSLKISKAMAEQYEGVFLVFPQGSPFKPIKSRREEK